MDQNQVFTGQPFSEALESKRNSIGQSVALESFDSLLSCRVLSRVFIIIDRAKMEKELERRGISHQNYLTHGFFRILLVLKDSCRKALWSIYKDKANS